MAGRQRAPRSEIKDPDRRIETSQFLRKIRQADYPSHDVAYHKGRTGAANSVFLAFIANRQDVEAK